MSELMRRERSPLAALRQWTLSLGFAAMLVTSGAPLLAQQDAGAVADTLRASKQPLFVPRDAIFAAGVVAGTLALAPLDKWAADQFQDPGRQGNKFLRETATGFRVLGNPGVIIVSAGMYLTGRVADRPNLADVGLHVGESIAAAGIATDLIKILAGRSRPEVDPDSPHSFALGRGWSEEGDRSFPSGHTSAAFAAAASISTEVGRLYPKAHVWVRPILYGSAGLVGLSRMYNNKHWLSDVAAGAALGSFAAWKVVGYNHTHPGNRVDRWMLGAPDQVAVDPVNNGVVLVWRF
jgi:membrane-associated phospholipid phosphatase